MYISSTVISYLRPNIQHTNTLDLGMSLSQEQNLEVVFFVIERGTVVLDVTDDDFGGFFEDGFEFVMEEFDAVD